jgi:lysophospholipase L1-like esterase
VHRNFAQPGATSGDVLAIQIPEALRFSPDLVTVVCGINDVLLPAHPDFGRYAARLKEIVLSLRQGAPGALVVTATCPNLASRLPLTERVLDRLTKEIDLLNEVTRSLARRLGVPYVELAAGSRDPSPADNQRPRVSCAACGTEAESVAEAFGELIERIHAPALAGG